LPRTTARDSLAEVAIQRWEEVRIGQQGYFLMNLRHPEVELRVIMEMDAGVAVFYDRRWETTAVLTEWLEQNLDVIEGKRVLVLGAGVGAETLVLGRHCQQVWLNDLAPVALELCAEQMQHNGLRNFTTLLGRYEDLELPEVDLVVASFLIYNKETLAAMRSFLSFHPLDVIIVNERLAPFRKFLKSQEHEQIFEQEATLGIRLRKCRTGESGPTFLK
jgi:predicted nicotinamide N-methyase